MTRSSPDIAGVAAADLAPPRRRDGAPSVYDAASTFGSTSFDQLATDTIERLRPRSAFDVCQVGVVLRAVVFVHGAIALGVSFAAASWQGWIALLAAGSAVALPGVLLWLVVACLLKRGLDRLPAGGQWTAAVALGAASGTAAAGLRLLAVPDLGDLNALIAPALSGAAMAAVLFYWLRLRASAQLPADAAARLAELQSRIRPHFLFNTLNTAVALVRHDPARAEGVLEDLAELFRVALTGGNEAVTLAEEVVLAQRYLAIEQIRFGQRLQVVWDLDAAADRARMPALLLQPLVENAVRHGIEPADDGGVIRIRTRAKGDQAVIAITNDVPDVPSQPGHGIALRNVRERLALMHDVSAQFDARRDGRAFRVQMVVPL